MMSKYFNRQKWANKKNKSVEKKASSMSCGDIDRKVNVNSEIEQAYSDISKAGNKGSGMQKNSKLKARLDNIDKKAKKAKKRKEEAMSMRSAKRAMKRRKD